MWVSWKCDSNCERGLPGPDLGNGGPGAHGERVERERGKFFSIHMPVGEF